ncbi:MAG: class I SAM-dependent methyltransferase [Firmicutes bacterium]|nr:class I SAM-dependent methyltransferase [Bacillota bacterium]
MDSEHYFTTKPTSKSDAREIAVNLRGKDYRFTTEAGVFSRSRVDPGTRLLIDALPLPAQGRMLDLGCGYGPVGIVAARERPGLEVIMVDINQRAVEFARINAGLNGVSEVDIRQGEDFAVVPERDFALIATNPPIRAGKRVIYPLLSKAMDHLLPNGTLYVVIRTKQGAGSLERHLITTYSRVETIAKGGGYRVFAAHT